MFSIAEFNFRMEVQNGRHCQCHQQWWNCSCPGEERKLALSGNLTLSQYFVPVAKNVVFIIFICNMFFYLNFKILIYRNIIIILNCDI